MKTSYQRLEVQIINLTLDDIVRTSGVGGPEDDPFMDDCFTEN